MITEIPSGDVLWKAYLSGLRNIEIDECHKIRLLDYAVAFHAWWIKGAPRPMASEYGVEEWFSSAVRELVLYLFPCI